MSQASFKNKLIHRMSPPDFEELEPHFEEIEVKARQVLVRRNENIEYIYFPETGHSSMFVRAEISDPIEVGTIGSEGMTDFALSGRSFGETIVQVGGSAIRVRRTVVTALVQESISLALLMLKWHQALLAQVSFTALSHGGYKISERLARFLLMLDDRTMGHEIPLAHEYFAWMLSVRRAGVSECLAQLAQTGAIDTGRGKIRILDRDKLIELARGSYGPAEREYERIFAAA